MGGEDVICAERKRAPKGTQRQKETMILLDSTVYYSKMGNGGRLGKWAQRRFFSGTLGNYPAYSMQFRTIPIYLFEK